MRKIYLLLTCISLFAGTINCVFAQTEAPKLTPKFFTLRNARLALGLGVEGSHSSFIANTSKPKSIKGLYNNPRDENGEIPYAAFCFNIDLFSDNSLTGLLLGANYGFLTQGYQSGDTAADFFDITKLEIPVYLKFRPGHYNDTSHLWLLIGGTYSLNLNSKRDHFNPPSSSIASYTDKNSDQLTKFFSASLSLGYEFYWGQEKLSRVVIYISGFYPLSSYINKNYKDFLSGGKSVFTHYTNPDIRDIRGVIGLKVLFGTRKKKT